MLKSYFNLLVVLIFFFDIDVYFYDFFFKIYFLLMFRVLSKLRV